MKCEHIVQRRSGSQFVATPMQCTKTARHELDGKQLCVMHYKRQTGTYFRRDRQGR